jgi:hypothetical protein
MNAIRSWWGVTGGLAVAGALLGAGGARAEVRLPPGFTAQVYVTGVGFGTSDGVQGRGIPSTSTLAVDTSGTLYLARTGRRYTSGEFDYLTSLYRVPIGGARFTPETEARYRHGPPLTNAQIGGGRRGRDLLVTTFDRERRIGVLYRLVEGRTDFLAGGTPADPTVPPLLVQPEGIAVNAAGEIYVADRARGVVLRLDRDGRVLDDVRVTRPRTLAVDEAGCLWIGGDGAAEVPWQSGPGEIWRVSPDGQRRLVAQGPMVQGLAPGPTGLMWVADRRGSEIFALAAHGGRTSLARFTDGDAPRGIAVVPATPETRAAGLAGDLLVAVIRNGIFQLNEIVRISGPFAELAQQQPAPSGSRP